MTRHLVYSAVSSGSAVLMLALLTIAGRTLGVADFGAFTYAITIATIAEVFMDFGLHQVTIRAIARDHTSAGRYFGTSLLLKLLPGVGMVLVFGGITLVLREEPVVRLACGLMLCSATMRSYLLTARGVLQGLERFRDDALITTLDRGLLVLCCGLALWWGLGVIGVSIVFLAVRVLTAGLSLLMVGRLIGRGSFDRALWRHLPGEALPVGLFLLVLNLYNRVDTVMLGAMVGDRETGLYGAAYPLYEGLTYATAVLSTVLVPRLSRLWREDRGAYARLARRALLASALLAVGIVVVTVPLAEVAVRLGFGPAYAPAGRTFRILLLGLPFVYVIWALHAVALSAHQTRVLLVVTAVGSCLNIGLNAAWIPRYAQDGAAAATVASEIVALGLLIYGLRHALAGRSAGQPGEPTPTT